MDTDLVLLRLCCFRIIQFCAESAKDTSIVLILALWRVQTAERRFTASVKATVFRNKLSCSEVIPVIIAAWIASSFWRRKVPCYLVSRKRKQARFNRTPAVFSFALTTVWFAKLFASDFIIMNSTYELTAVCTSYS